MRYSLTEIVQASGHPVDTIRYYQSQGLLHAPEHEGRMAVYDDSHLDRLRLVRSMSKRGLTLKAIRMLLERGGERLDSDQILLAAIEEEAAEPSYTSDEMAARLGVPRALLTSVESTGIVEGQEQADGTTRYTDGDLRVARGAIKLLEYGFPLMRLLALAIKHDRAMRKTVDGAIDLFDDNVRKRGSGRDADPDAVTRAFKDLLPIVTGIVAHHFQRVLVNRALKRLKRSGEKGPLEIALKVAAKSRLGVRWQ